MVLHAIYYVIILPKMKKKSGKSIIKFLIINMEQIKIQIFK